MKFSKYRTLFFMASVLLGIALYSVTFLQHKGFARSIAFNGGFRFSVQFEPGTGKEQIEGVLKKNGYASAQVRLASTRLNQFDIEFDPDVTVAGQASEKPGHPEKAKIDQLEDSLISFLPVSGRESIISREKISASYGEDLLFLTIKTLLMCIGFISIYLSVRFTVPFAIGASLALLHDVILTVGFIGAAQIKPSIPVVAAILTVIGYSINDTIVVFDRIRDLSPEAGLSVSPETSNLAITQTLSRTVITSFSTLLVVIALIAGGAQALLDFALILFFGIVVGTYSSIFIAAHFVQWYSAWRDRQA